MMMVYTVYMRWVMIYTDMTKKAMRISYEAHHGTYDKGGVPYVFHPIHVAEMMQDEYSTTVALLHDVVEDTDYTLDKLIEDGFPDEIVEAVDAITRRSGEDYFVYIDRVKANALATTVKIADLEHNTDDSRLAILSDANIKKQRYEKAKRVLKND